MDSSPAFSADLLAALFSVNERTGLPGALAEGTSQRGPPGEFSGQPTGLAPGIMAFADLLSGFALPLKGGGGLPAPGNALPSTLPATEGLAVVPHPEGIAAALSSTPARARLGPSNLAVALPVAMPSNDGAPVAPADEALRLAPQPAPKVETAPATPLLHAPDEPPAPLIDTPLRPPLPAPESRRTGPSPGLAKGALAEDPVPFTTSSTPVPPSDWRLTERPIKLPPQQVSPETPTKEPPDVSVTVRQATTSGALPESSGVTPSGWVTTTPATPGAASTESLIPAPTPFTGTPQGGVDPAALAGRVHWMIDNAVGEARLRLNPPELGALDIKISMVDDKAYVQLAATQMGATELLEAALPRLRELLNVGGLELAGATVSHEDTERSAPESPAQDSTDAESEEALEPTPARRASGEIDLYA